MEMLFKKHTFYISALRSHLLMHHTKYIAGLPRYCSSFLKQSRHDFQYHFASNFRNFKSLSKLSCEHYLAHPCRSFHVNEFNWRKVHSSASENADNTVAPKTSQLLKLARLVKPELSSVSGKFPIFYLSC